MFPRLCIGVVDNVNRHFPNLLAALEERSNEIAIYWCGDVEIGWQPSLPVGTKLDLLLCHWTQRHILDAFPEAGASARVKIAYSGGGVSPSDQLDGWYRVSRAFDGGNKLSELECRSLVEWLMQGAKAVDRPPILRDTPQPVAIALDILCTGFLIVHRDLVRREEDVERNYLIRLDNAVEVVADESWWTRGLGLDRPEHLRQKLLDSGISVEAVERIMAFWLTMFVESKVNGKVVVDLQKAIRVAIGYEILK